MVSPRSNAFRRDGPGDEHRHRSGVGTWHTRQLCPVTRKIRYRDHAEAVDALHSCVALRHWADDDGVATRRQERRSYLCPGCGGWHLTSKPDDLPRPPEAPSR